MECLMNFIINRDLFWKNYKMVYQRLYIVCSLNHFSCNFFAIYVNFSKKENFDFEI